MCDGVYFDVALYVKISLGKRSIIIEPTQVITMARLHSLWDRRRIVKWLLVGAAVVALSVSLAFSVLVASGSECTSFTITLHAVPVDILVVASQPMCALLEKPWALPFALGALVSLAVNVPCCPIHQNHVRHA